MVNINIKSIEYLIHIILGLDSMGMAAWDVVHQICHHVHGASNGQHLPLDNCDVDQ